MLWEYLHDLQHRYYEEISKKISLIYHQLSSNTHLICSFDLKAKLACHPARCLLAAEITERCDLASGPATAIFIALLIR